MALFRHPLLLLALLMALLAVSAQATSRNIDMFGGIDRLRDTIVDNEAEGAFELTEPLPEVGRQLKVFKKIRKGFNKAVNTVANNKHVQQGVKAVGGNKHVQNGVNSVNNALNKGHDYANQGFNTVKNGAVNTVNGATDYVKQGVKTVKNGVVYTVNGGRDYANQGFNYAKQGFNTVKNGAVNTANRGSDYVKQGFNTGVNTVNRGHDYAKQQFNTGVNFANNGYYSLGNAAGFHGPNGK